MYTYPSFNLARLGTFHCVSQMRVLRGEGPGLGSDLRHLEDATPTWDDPRETLWAQSFLSIGPSI